MSWCAAVLESSPPDDAPVRGYCDHQKGTDVTAWNPSQGWSAGAILCTATDLARFGHALIDGTLFEKPATTARMRDFVTGRRGLALTVSAGYGIGLQKFGEGAFGHRGQTLGFNSILLIFPEFGVVAVALTNDAQGPSLFVQGRPVARFATKPGELPAGHPKPAGHPHGQPAGAR